MIKLEIFLGNHAVLSNISTVYYRRMGRNLGQAGLRAKTARKSKEKPLISCEISGYLVAGAGFEPTAFGL